MMALKITGGLLIIGATSLMGYLYSRRNGQRIEDLTEMKKALTVLKGEVRFLLRPFGEAALEVSKRVEGDTAAMFLYAGEMALKKDAEGASEIWEEAVKSIEGACSFTGEDLSNFASLGKNLGLADREMQNEALNLLIEYIDNTTEYLRGINEGQSKMYRSLGVLFGLLITVVMI